MRVYIYKSYNSLLDGVWWRNCYSTLWHDDQPSLRLVYRVTALGDLLKEEPNHINGSSDMASRVDLILLVVCPILQGSERFKHQRDMFLSWNGWSKKN